MPAETGVGPNVTTLNKILGIAGVALLLGGLALGFRSVSAGAVDCGSVFAPAGGITPMACDGKLDSSATLVTAFVVAGVLSLAVAIALKVLHDRRVDA
ncbi:hypothetical protein Kfla_1901 [Kribbella flavida DSM 17836]|uniref:Uncharacterized protein n=1 Tax=Kribbella flavida (strain DSM 17836 / JCM 10339 / NBRC 14399) TaxID=479435 RepID=D2PPN3_KRIFD|nr:hypothetical protein [Kribbella flavida]ADB30995.1 hypothetical protein Kfla_1901 [Kribbella flavida DSM 17836]